MVLKNCQILSNVLNGKIDVANPSFTSQQDIIDKLMEVEREHAICLRELSDEEYDQAEKHSSFYNELLKKKFIRVQKFTDNSELYSLNLLSPNYGKVLNKEGFFAIRDTIYQITSDNIKMWIKGDINNYDYLNEIKTTDASKNIYVFENTSELNLLTKSIPVINRADQTVAYCDYNANRLRRIVVSFYDETTLNIPQEGYNRNVFVRFSNQEKLDRRNFVFTSGPYAMDAQFEFIDPIPIMHFVVNGTSADVWYTVYFKYQFLNRGKDTQLITTKEDYYSLKDVFFVVESYIQNSAGNNDSFKSCYLVYKGERRADNDIFVYHSNSGGERLLEMLPE